MLSLLSLALALDTKKIPNQEIYLDDRGIKSFSTSVQFAVLGDTRPAVAGEGEATKRVTTSKTTEQIVADLSGTIRAGRTEFIVLLGNLVPSSSVAAWKQFSQAWSLVLSGSEPPEGGQLRVRTLPVVGSTDGIQDDRYFGFGAAFPGVGADIGFNRVATWYHVDLDVSGHTWRLVSVDSNKPTMGSRWDEQMAYIEAAFSADQGEYDSVLVFVHHPLITLAAGQSSNEGGATSELLSQIDGATKVGAIKAVFSSHSHAGEVYLPRGKFGELYVNAGGGGAPADNLARWGHAEAGGFPDVKLETTFDFALLRELEKQAAERKCSPAAIDHAKSTESWKGFPGEYEAGCFPVQGWWDVTLTGEKLSLSWRQVQPDGTLRAIYTADFGGKKTGWSIGQ